MNKYKNGIAFNTPQSFSVKSADMRFYGAVPDDMATSYNAYECTLIQKTTHAQITIAADPFKLNISYHICCFGKCR